MSEKKSMMAIAIAKSICKEYSTSSYSRVVYLENGQEFQIQLFNPHNFTIGVEIFINDEKLSNRLVLKPGERVWLERYLDIKKKFKFSTYEVEGNNKDVQEAIKANGNIEVKFYKESRNKEYYPSVIVYDNNWLNKNDNITYPSPINVFYNISNDLITGNYCNYTSKTSNFCTDLNTNCTSSISTQDTNYTSSISTQDTNYTSSISTPDEMICETGRIETGSQSTQEFNNVNIDFEYFPFVTEKIKLLPISQKPFTPNDLHKIYCPECGRKLKSTYKFCPFCGSKID